MKKNFLFVRFWLPVVVWCMIIFYLSGLPNLSSGLGVWDLIFRKIAHITEYGILTMLLWRAFNFHNVKNVYNLSGTLAVLYAISDEIHQGFVPTRHPSFYDILFDAFGVFLVLFLITKISRLRRILIS